MYENVVEQTQLLMLSMNANKELLFIYGVHLQGDAASGGVETDFLSKLYSIYWEGTEHRLH